MAQISVTINGKSFRMACDDGDERDGHGQRDQENIRRYGEKRGFTERQKE